MTDHDIIDYVRSHPSQKVKLALADIDGILRGKYISVEKFLSAIKSDLGFCNVVFGWDSGDLAYDTVAYTGWHTGYPDVPCKIDLSSFRKIPYEDQVPFFLCNLVQHKSGDQQVCPRSLLQKITLQSERLGYTPYFSQEFEWFNFNETSASAQDKNYSGLQPLTPGMFGYSILRTSLKNEFFSDLYEQLKAFDIPLEGIHTETGPGVYEAAITYSNILEAADRATLFKTAVKEIAYRHGIMATFMAKWSEQLPGCSGHIHQSLWDKESTYNLFYDETHADHMSEVFRYYIAGQLYCLPHILPMYAPTINSYKRLVEGAWAPTTLTWAVDNRTVALRALPVSAKGCRLETRVVGSDVNPYLAMAACLASGLYGIQHKLSLQDATVGNGYQDVAHGILPGTLWAATQAMKSSDLAKTLFGTEFVSHFTATREWECRQYNKVVTDWEKRRYFEII